jgi:lipoprotein-anchoring transpeptidase ErfK/SrfK
MRRAAVLCLLVLAAVPSAASAAAKAPVTIAPGTRVGGVDVGGLTVADAATALRDTFSAAYSLPVHVTVAKRRFTVYPGQVGFRFDQLATARQALAAGRAGRAVRVPLVTAVDATRLAQRVAAIDAATTIPARSATIRIGLRRMRIHPSKPGRSLVAPVLARRLSRTLESASRARAIGAHRSVVHPAVRTRDLRSGRYGTIVTVDQRHFRLRLFKRGRFVKSYGVAVGQPAYPTPNGLFSITNKAVNPTWNVPDSPWAGALRNETVPGGSAQNPLKARWMGIVNGVGIHGTAESGSIGSRASHGCVRMRVPDVIDLYPRVPIGTPVLIA